MSKYKLNSSLIYLSSVICLVAGACKVNEDCDVTDSVCFKNQCVCPKGYVMNSDMTHCLKSSEGYGAACTDSIQCSSVLLSGGQCVNGVCICAEGYHYFKGRCWKTSGLGESCSKNNNCYVSYDFEASVCSDRKCVCAQGYYQREYSSCRRLSADPGDGCLISLDCDYDNALCLKNRTCGHINQTDLPYPPPSPTQKPPVRPASNYKLGGKCSSNADCGGLKYALCSQFKECSCAPGYYPVNNSLCYPELGSYCTQDSECVGEYMMCRKDKRWCTCKDGYVAAADNRYCTKMSRDIGWSCLSDRWCSTFGPGGICEDKHCTCAKATHFIPAKIYCWISKKVGEKCLRDEDCGSTGAETCSNNGLCTCSSGFHASSNRTVCRKDGNNVGDFCEEPLDCLFKESTCNVKNNTCICKPGYFLLNGACQPGVGGQCNKGKTCQAEGSVCNGTTCTCHQNFVSSLDYRRCLPEATEYLSECSESQQCTALLGEGGICQENNCTCSQGFHNVENRCYVDVVLYGNCTQTAQCQAESEYAECRKGICQCAYQYPPDAFNRTCTDDGSMIYPSLLVTFSSIALIIKHLTR